MVKPFIVVMGASNSGKNHFADVALKNGYDVEFKWIAGLKRSLESLYELPVHALEFDFYRNSLVPNQSYTFLDLLIMLYREQEQADPLALRMFKEAAFNKLQSYLARDWAVVSTDTRSPREMLCIKELSESYPVALVRIHGRGTILDSDKSLDRNWQTVIPTASRWVMFNDSTLEDFTRHCVTMVRDIEMYHAKHWQ